MKRFDVEVIYADGKKEVIDNVNCMGIRPALNKPFLQRFGAVFEFPTDVMMTRLDECRVIFPRPAGAPWRILDHPFPPVVVTMPQGILTCTE